jgi:hypothetical protein
MSFWYCETCAVTSAGRNKGTCAVPGCGGSVRAQLDRDELTALVTHLLDGSLGADPVAFRRASAVFRVNAAPHGVKPAPLLERALEDQWPVARVMKAIFAGERTEQRTPTRRSAKAKADRATGGKKSAPPPKRR